MSPSSCRKSKSKLIFKLLTLPEDPFLSSDVRLQLSSSDVDADRLWQVTNGLGHHGFSCITRLEPGCFQPHILTLVKRAKKLLHMLTPIGVQR